MLWVYTFRFSFDPDTTEACIVAGILDMDSFAAASSTEGFMSPPRTAATYRQAATPMGDIQDERELTLQEVMDEEEALARSVADQTKV